MTQPTWIFGEVLFDIFPDGQQVLGGAPFNVAWHLQAFGQSPVFISRVGIDRQGKAIRDAMANWQLSTRALQEDASLPTGRVTIALQGGEPHYDIVSPCAYDAIDASTVPTGRCGLLYHGSLALRHPPSAAALEQIFTTKPERVFVDVNLRPPWWDKPTVLNLFRQADWVKLNQGEFDQLWPGDGNMGERMEDFLASFELEGVILTHGEDGASLLTRNREHLSVKPEPAGQLVDTVGAGDAFTSVMILGILKQWPMALTLERAQQFASGIVGQRGATVPDIEFYNNIMSGWTKAEA